MIVHIRNVVQSYESSGRRYTYKQAETCFDAMAVVTVTILGGVAAEFDL